MTSQMLRSIILLGALWLLLPGCDGSSDPYDAGEDLDSGITEECPEEPPEDGDPCYVKDMQCRYGVTTCGINYWSCYCSFRPEEDTGHFWCAPAHEECVYDDGNWQTEEDGGLEDDGQPGTEADGAG